MDDNAMADAAYQIERAVRHQQATSASDFQHLRNCLREAAQRFFDIADLIETDASYNPVPFLRASANRYKRESEQSGQVEERAEKVEGRSLPESGDSSAADLQATQMQ